MALGAAESRFEKYSDQLPRTYWLSAPRSGCFQHVANSLLQAIGAERILQRDDLRRTSVRSDFGVDGTRHVNNLEVRIIQFEKFREFQPVYTWESHFGQQ